MADIQAGFTFTGNSPNNAVTAPNLNALVGAAVIQSTFVTAKTEKTMPAAADYMLLWDSVSGTFQKVSIQNLVPSGVAAGWAQGLIITNGLGGSPSPTTLTVTAAQFVMRSSGGAIRYVSSFSGSVSTGTTGVNGRDYTTGGGAGASVWGYIWAISTGSVDSLLFSSSSTSPVLPVGYVYSLLLGAARLNAAGTLVDMNQRGSDVEIQIGAIGSLATSTASTTPPNDILPYIGSNTFSKIQINATAGLFTSVDLTRCIPPIATRVRGLIGAADASGVNFAYGIMSQFASANLIGSPPTVSAVTGVWLGQLFGRGSITTNSALGFSNVAAFDILTNQSSPQTIYVASDDNSGAGPAGQHSLRITGYHIG